MINIKSSKFFILAISIFTLTSLSFAQGCGDAGACSIDAVKYSDEESTEAVNKNQFRLGANIGKAQFDVDIYSAYLEYTRSINSKASVSAKLTSSMHQGDITTNAGLNDIYLSGTYQFIKNFKAILGVKLPLNKANASYNDLNLPMSYQTSLGTTDLIAGIGYKKKHFAVSLAYQKPLIQNDNQFYLSEYPQGSIVSSYQSTYGYERQDDILLRVSYAVNFLDKKLTFIPSLLPIYHLGRDTYINEANQRVEIANSEGLTFNMNLFLQYHINKNNSIEVSYGAPLVTRKARPDGLTAKAYGLEYIYRF
jgi:hypothetical protein